MSTEDSEEKDFGVLYGGAGRETYSVPPEDFLLKLMWQANTKRNEEAAQSRIESSSSIPLEGVVTLVALSGEFGKMLNIVSMVGIGLFALGYSVVALFSQGFIAFALYLLAALVLGPLAWFISVFVFVLPGAMYYKLSRKFSRELTREEKAKKLTRWGKVFVGSVFFMVLMYISPLYSVYWTDSSYYYEWNKFLSLQLTWSHAVPVLAAALTAIPLTLLVFTTAKKRQYAGKNIAHPLLRLIYYPFMLITAATAFLVILNRVI